MENKIKNHGMAAVFAALFANLLVAVSKFIGFLLSGSAAMMNEAIHSLVDTANEALLLLGNKRAKRGQSDIHQFGEGRAKYFYSMIVATLLFFGGGVIGVIEAWDKLTHQGHSIENPILIFVILTFGIIIESSSLRVAFREIHELNKQNLPLFQFLRNTKHSEILVIFAEDTSAIIGLLLAVFGTALTFITGNGFYDAFSGLLIGLLLMSVSILLIREFYSLLVGERVSNEDLAVIKAAFERGEVEHIINIRTTHLSADEILVAAKIDIKNSEEAHDFDIVNKIESQIRRGLTGKKCYIYIEIDEWDENYSRR
ncbi:cation diffusion facilitator family transporter [Lactovum miscens]|uniref:Cation diffusion facilitator family transporter n=1 Tax=Lactovum miscens TaxID=190387 RepID=A0A841C7Y3_9LACT|nr:cation diffusion facilitator family transporter [Lactovum miscens]MBB5887350.1 cation diffusion facilitator family transporter [Lactovum miscens]